MAIEDKLIELQQVKTDIHDAIEAKGQSLDGVPFTEYAGAITAIQGGGGVAGQEIEITSAVSNTSQLADILFNNMDITKYMFCAALTRPKNNTLINNQVFMLSVYKRDNCGFRFRNGGYGQVLITSEYDAAVTIGDIYTVYCVGEFSYGN